MKHYTTSVYVKRKKKHIGENYSKYNYNIIKLRNGIFYTKTLFENIDSLFNDINIENIININNINYYDNLLNDKNIYNFYNETNYILNKIKSEGNRLLEEPLQNLVEYFNDIYLYNNDYSKLLGKFKEIIALKNNDFNNNITNKKEDIFNNVFEILKEFNRTLFKQLSLISNYTIYNINETYFKNIYTNYQSLIENLFKEYKNKINSFGNNYKFHNLIKKIFKKFFDKKKGYYKDIINEFSNIYILNVFDSLYDVGEYQSNSIQNLFNKYELSKKYEYVEIYEINTSSYINKIISIINYLESKIKEKLKNIYDNFYKIFNKNITTYVSINFVEQLNNNYTTCLEYKDRESFNNKIEFINIIFENCSNETNITDIENYSLNEKINYIKENGCLSDTDNISFYNNIEYINHYNNCYNHNFYNYTAFYFNNFDNTYKSELDNITNEILNEIKNNYFDENYLSEYFDNTFELEPYKNIEINEIESYLEDIEDMIIYVNNNKKDDIQNYILNSLIYSFNSSYLNLFNSFIVNELTDNVNVLINNKLEIYFDYIIKKAQNEFHYYLLILNNTDEMGDNSKNAFLNLYKKINKEVNETLINFIEDEIYYYLDIFYQKNKNNFRNNFITFYTNTKNKYNINLDKFSDFFKEIIIDMNFNKTLDNISKDLIYNFIINKIKTLINNSIYLKIQNLKQEIQNIQINMEEILDNIPTQELPENMLIINNLINNYTEVVNNQSNKYLLKISDKPLNLSNEFIQNDLKPPLLLIQEAYREIEENLFKDILEIIKTFPDFYSLIKNELDLESIIKNISLFYKEIKEILINYVTILDKDLESYTNKISYYAFIEGLNSYDKPCNESFCMVNLENNNNYKNQKRRRVSEIGKIKNIKNINITKNIRNLDGYNSKMGAITEEDIDSYILEIKDTLFNFNSSYLNKEYENMKKSLNLFIMKISNIYLVKLKTNIDLVASKFSNMLTKDIYMQLKNKLFEQYIDIEAYIQKYSKLVENDINYFSELLNDSSELIKLSYDISFYRVKGYYQIISELIQTKLKYISKEEKNGYKVRILNEDGFRDSINITINALSNVNEYFRDERERNEDIFSDNHDEGISYSENNNETDNEIYNENNNKANDDNNNENKQGDNDSVQSDSNNNIIQFNQIDIPNQVNYYYYSKCFNIYDSRKRALNRFDFSPSINIYTGLSLGISFKPEMVLDICIEIGSSDNKDDPFEYIEVSGKSEVGISLDFGLYIPFAFSPLSFSINFGLAGTLGSGNIGMKLELFFTGEKKNFNNLDSFSEFESHSFYFFIKFQFNFNFIFFKFSFGFYIANKKYEISTSSHHNNKLSSQ